MMTTVFVIGGVAWDTIVHTEHFPQPVSQTVFPLSVWETIGSTGAGKALNLARLGVPVHLHGRIGDDDNGRRIRRYLSDAGVPFLFDLDPAGTRRHFNLMDASGERITIWLEGSTADLTMDEAAVHRLVDEAGVVVLNIMDYARRFIPYIRHSGKQTWIDIHDYDGVNVYHDEFIEVADVIFLSSNLLPDYRSFMATQIERGKSLVVCTHGADGASALTSDGDWFEIDAQPGVDVIDTNGAGDAFFSGYLYAHLCGQPVEHCLQAAAYVAARCVQSTELADPNLRDKYAEEKIL